MTAARRRRGFGHIDLLTVIIIIGILIALLLPAIQATRELARRNTCLAKMKQLRLALHQMAGPLPPSCTVRRSPDTGEIIWMDGWSWCVETLPSLEQQALYDVLATQREGPLEHLDERDHPHTTALGMALPEFRCPSFAGEPWIDPDTKFEAITNYKAMGATHVESLNVASVGPLSKNGLYGETKDHPDGGIHPGSKLFFRDFAQDGSAHTILLVETKEQYRARWTVGREACLVGLPAREVGMTFEEPSIRIRHWHLKGWTPNRWDDDTTLPEINHTYLDWDYKKKPYNDGGVSEGGLGISPFADPKATFYGPSSDHPGVVTHAFADGSVYSIKTEIDAAAYMFLITRKGDDPYPPEDTWKQ